MNRIICLIICTFPILSWVTNESAETRSLSNLHIQLKKTGYKTDTRVFKVRGRLFVAPTSAMNKVDRGIGPMT